MELFFLVSFKIQFLSTLIFIHLFLNFKIQISLFHYQKLHVHGPLLAICSAISGPLEVPEPQVGNTHSLFRAHTHAHC